MDVEYRGYRIEITHYDAYHWMLYDENGDKVEESDLMVAREGLNDQLDWVVKSAEKYVDYKEDGNGKV